MMKQHKLSSKLITFEGPEGAGKSTQIALLTEVLRNAGSVVVPTREPGGTPLAEELRSLVKEERAEKIHPETEALLMAAARAQHVHEVIQPALDRGEVVLCDRFSDSTLAYQGYARGMDVARLRELCLFASANRVPDLTILLDVDPACGFARVRQRGEATAAIDRFELAGNEFHRKVRQGFLALAQLEPQRIKVVNAMDAPEVVHQRIIKVLHDAFRTI